MCGSFQSYRKISFIILHCIKIYKNAECFVGFVHGNREAEIYSKGVYDPQSSRLGGRPTMAGNFNDMFGNEYATQQRIQQNRYRIGNM